ncbi:M48 family metalloprotease [Sulfidibacter corallicola]|uniref:M48 family metalloprotease n=1 Tax=Sulfidibacter corallicola TaxID=2818388 RepID=A0A8A4TGN1_SULCO|nr:M48 family metalloprotease [Sulfidibacter corallicola]QTD49076.1 M48 family metalloprotease [Sulfidibacter corallicola]
MISQPRFRFCLVPIFLLFGLTGPPLWAKPRIMPELQVDISGSEGRPVQVRLSARSSFSLNYRQMETKVSEGDGRLVFASQPVKRMSWMVVTLAWQPAGLAERVLVYELRMKKGPKTPKGRLLVSQKQKSGYLLDSDFPIGDCNHLFNLTQNDGVLRLAIDLPPSYLACEEGSGSVNDFNAVGNRDINQGQFNFYKFDDDLRMGNQFYREMGATPENPPLQDRQINGYVRNLVTRIGKASDMPHLDYKVTVIDADVLNAFAVPGGYVFVYRGLLNDVQSEAELAGVLAHEIAHVTGRHGTEGVTSAISKTALAMAAGELVKRETKDKDAWIGSLVQGVISGGTQYWIVGGTRKREAEADKLGAQYAQRAGYDPRGIATLFERWSQKKGHQASRLDQMFSDHPSDEARVAAVMRDVHYFLPPSPDLVRTSPEFQKMKKRLAQLPPPAQKGQTAGNALFSAFQRVNEAILSHEIRTHLESGDKKE